MGFSEKWPRKFPTMLFLEWSFYNRLDFIISVCIWMIINTGLHESLTCGAHPLILGRPVPRPSETNDCLLYFSIHPKEWDPLSFSQNIFQHLTNLIARDSNFNLINISTCFLFLCNCECVVQLVTDGVCSRLCRLPHMVFIPWNVDKVPWKTKKSSKAQVRRRLALPPISHVISNKLLPVTHFMFCSPWLDETGWSLSPLLFLFCLRDNEICFLLQKI